MTGMKDFMNEKRIVDRWFVVKVALWGTFAGALLTVAFVTLIGLGYP